MPTLTFLLALLFASFHPATTNAPGKNDQKTTKVTKGKPNNGDYIIGVDVNPYR